MDSADNVNPDVLFRQNLRAVKSLHIDNKRKAELRQITNNWMLSVAAGELTLISQHWYITHAGLLGIAHGRHCHAIKTQLERSLSDATERRWIVRAIVYPSPDSSGFTGYGDADPSNVLSTFYGCELRIAETRAVNRALRKAYGIGICSVEELANTDQMMAAPSKFPATSANGNRSHASHSVRDQLCALIRKHRLDADLVKRYAADFCGTETLRNASRDLVQDFVKRLSEEAEGDKPALLCRLNSYSDRQVSVS
jgi:hypothetical protein